MSENIGIVVIGRNEGERLRACLQSLQGQRVVYVDSQSSDNSRDIARSLDTPIVELDMSLPFSASRARNEGVAALRRLYANLDFVQFVDGDSTIAPAWLQTAATFMEDHPDYAVVAGRLHERFPDKSIYNRLCDIEWNTPPGDTTACGGIAMFRLSAFLEVGGFNPAVPAGEEPELCVRLRQRAWKIHRLADDMGRHDAAMTHVGQWWRRAVRGGYAFAQGAHIHGNTPQRHWVREVRSNWLWGLALPLLILASAWPTRGLSLLLLLAYVYLGARIYRHMRSRDFSRAHAALYSYFCVIAKFANALGQMRFHLTRLKTRSTPTMHYEKPAAAGQI